MSLDDEYRDYLRAMMIEREIGDNYELHNIIERWLITNAQKGSLFSGLLIENVNPKFKHRLDLILANPIITDRTAKPWIDNFVIGYGKFRKKIKKERFNLLISKTSVLEIVRAGLKYESLLPRGQQWSIPFKVYRQLVGAGATIECFASPFNSQIQLIHPELKFCSIYKSDKVFGSLGSFFNVKAEKFIGRFCIVNPPFVESILFNTVQKCLSILSKGKCRFIFYGPAWTDSEFYKIITQSKTGKRFLRNKKILKQGEHFYEYEGKGIVARFNSVVFELCS